jgi:hypothetical protein
VGVTATNNLEALGWKNPDNSQIAVIYNPGGAMMLTVSIGGKMVQFQMPATGWATVNLPAN